MIILHIMGHLGADPEMRYTTKGQKVWNLRVASKSRKNGQDETVWWRITVWGDAYDKMLAHFKKGSGIYIIAEMNKLDIYTDKNGAPQVSYEATARSIHFPPFGERNSEGGEGAEERKGSSASYQNNSGSGSSYGAANGSSYGSAGGNGYGSNSGGNQSYQGAYSHQIATGSRQESFDDDEPMPF